MRRSFRPPMLHRHALAATATSANALGHATAVLCCTAQLCRELNRQRRTKAQRREKAVGVSGTGATEQQPLSAAATAAMFPRLGQALGLLGGPSDAPHNGPCDGSEHTQPPLLLFPGQGAQSLAALLAVEKTPSSDKLMAAASAAREGGGGGGGG